MATATKGSLGAGQADPSDSRSDLTATEFLVRSLLAFVDTMKVVRVVAVHGGGIGEKAGTVDVLPLVGMIDGAGNVTKHGVVHSIPWVRLQGGTGAMICDPVVGDVGIVVCADRDSSAVKGAVDAGEDPQVSPGSRRTHNIADGIYVGGCFNDAPEQHVAFTADGVELKDKHGSKVVTSAAGITITPAPGLPVTIDGLLVVNGNVQLSGDFLGVGGAVYAGNLRTGGAITAGYGTGDQVNLQTHRHTQPNDSRGDTEAATNAPTAGS